SVVAKSPCRSICDVPIRTSVIRASISGVCSPSYLMRDDLGIDPHSPGRLCSCASQLPRATSAIAYNLSHRAPGEAGKGVTMAKPKIAVFSGPTATIQNSEPLVTSNKARAKYGLPLRTHPDGSPIRFDALRPQRLAAPVTLYIEQFSAHPLERDAAKLYAPPDGYLDASGVFHKARQGPHDVPVYEIILHPEDGLYPLPYMARQANGQAWEDDGATSTAPAAQCRQPVHPDASRLFEEIDRLGIGDDGVASLLSANATFDFYRALPSGGYTQGLPASQRTDMGEGDIRPETLGQDFFPYRPTHL